jgi:hypothetical protein
MSSVLWLHQLLSQPCLPTISSVLYTTNPPPRTHTNLYCYVLCNQRVTTSVPHPPLAPPSLDLHDHEIALNGKRAARQQGDPFSMGGSSNGGKAIGTLWCKSMFGSGWCQDTIPANRNTLILLNLHQNRRFSSVFPCDSPLHVCNRVPGLRNGHSGPEDPSAGRGSDSPGAGSRTPVP